MTTDLSAHVPADEDICFECGDEVRGLVYPTDCKEPGCDCNPNLCIPCALSRDRDIFE